MRGLLIVPIIGFGLWGSVVALKGLYDLFIGEPEANLYAPAKWAFVTQQQWLRYAGFELVYGLCLVGLAYALRRYSRFLPETVTRASREPELRLFE